MTHDRFVMREKGGIHYEASGPHALTGLLCFTGLSVLRSIPKFMGWFAGGGGVLFVLKHFFLR